MSGVLLISLAAGMARDPWLAVLLGSIASRPSKFQIPDAMAIYTTLEEEAC